MVPRAEIEFGEQTSVNELVNYRDQNLVVHDVVIEGLAIDA